MAPEIALLIAVVVLTIGVVLLGYQLAKALYAEQARNHELVTMLAVKNDPKLAPLAHTQPSRQHQPQPDEPDVIFPEGG